MWADGSSGDFDCETSLPALPERAQPADPWMYATGGAAVVKPTWVPKGHPNANGGLCDGAKREIREGWLVDEPLKK